MKHYIGTKSLLATPMDRENYNFYRGWVVPSDEEGKDEGYLVEYPDGKSNHSNHSGYISWSPKSQFEEAYRSHGEFDFGHALYFLKKGYHVSRSGWNGKNMWIALQEGSTIRSNLARSGVAKGRANEGVKTLNILPHIDMRAADGSIVIGWLASQTDMLAEDWGISPRA